MDNAQLDRHKPIHGMEEFFEVPILELEVFPQVAEERSSEDRLHKQTNL